MITCLLLAEFSGPGATDVHIRKIRELQGTLKDTTQQSKYTEERLENVSKCIIKSLESNVHMYVYESGISIQCRLVNTRKVVFNSRMVVSSSV